LLYSFINLGARWGGWSTPRPRPFNPRERPGPLYRRLGGPQGWSRRVRKISPRLGFDRRTVQPDLAGYISSSKCAIVAAYSNHICELNHNINSERNFLCCATIAFSKCYDVFAMAYSTFRRGYISYQLLFSSSQLLRNRAALLIRPFPSSAQRVVNSCGLFALIQQLG
jgi:hypothetical protein